MAGLDTRGAFDGFQQGFQMANSYIQQQAANKRADAQTARQDRMADLQAQEYEAREAARTEAKDKEKIAQFYTAWGNGIETEITPELEASFKRQPMADPRHLLNPKVEQAVDYAGKLAQGEGRLFSNETVDALNDFYGPRINRGDGGQKKLAGIYPGQKPGTFSFELEVDQDGKKRMAPMTVNRGIDGHDDEVAQYSAEQAIAPVLGAKSIYDALSDNKDKMRQYLQATGYMPKGADNYEIEERNGVMLQRNTATGEYKTLYKPKETADKGTWSEVRARDDGSLYQVNSLTNEEKTTYKPSKNNGLTASGGKPLPVPIQKLVDERIEAAGTMRGINSQIDNLVSQIDKGTLDVSLASRANGEARNFFGISDEKSKNLAIFDTTLMDLVNGSLQLNKGVQTDGDAMRAEKALIAGKRDNTVVKEQLLKLKSLNERAYTRSQERINQLTKANGGDAINLDTVLGYDQEGSTETPAAGSKGLQVPSISALEAGLNSGKSMDSVVKQANAEMANKASSSDPVFQKSEGGYDYYSWNGKTIRKPSTGA